MFFMQADIVILSDLDCGTSLKYHRAGGRDRAASFSGPLNSLSRLFILTQYYCSISEFILILPLNIRDSNGINALLQIFFCLLTKSRQTIFHAYRRALLGILIHLSSRHIHSECGEPIPRRRSTSARNQNVRV